MYENVVHAVPINCSCVEAVLPGDRSAAEVEPAADTHHSPILLGALFF
jgi:hypothetical protein